MTLKTIRIKYSLFFAVIGLILIYSNSSFAQSSTAKVNKDSLTIGEVFSLTIKLQLDQSYERIIFPDSASFPSSIEWIRTQQFRVTGFADSALFDLQFFGNSDEIISPLKLSLVNGKDTTVVFTNPVNIFFKTVLKSENEEFRPLKPIFDIKVFPWALIIIVSAILLALLYGYYTYKKKSNLEITETPIVIEPFKSPLSELEANLTYLKQDYNLAITKDYKFFFTSLSDSVRRYYEDLYDIPALESTSRELFRYLDAFGVDHEMIKSTRKLLNSSDMVKFAKFSPTLDDAWLSYQQAVDFLDRARQIDSSRISRKKFEYEQQFEKIKTESTTEISKEAK